MASGLRAGNVSMGDGFAMGAGRVLGVVGIAGLIMDPASALGGPTTTMGDATVTGAFDRAMDTASNPNGIDTKYVQGALDLLQTGLTIGAMDDPANVQLYTANLQSYLENLSQNGSQGGLVNAPPQTITFSKH
jgi:hypothetical protein